MANGHRGGMSAGMQMSPWIILGSTLILLLVVMVLAYQNTNRESRHMSELLRAKGAALILAVEAGARTGMMGMTWGSQQIQELLEETAQLPDVLYMAVIDQNSRVVAHSDPSQINKPFDNGRKIKHIGPDELENWELVTKNNQQRIFEVHRHFRPLGLNDKSGFDHMHSMMPQHRMNSSPSNDWFSPAKIPKLMIIVGLDVAPFEEAIRSDIETTIVLSVIMLLLGFGGFISLFWMHSYRAARKSLQDTSAFADEVVGHLPVGLIATDQSGKISFFNAAAEKITGLVKTSVQDMTMDDLLPDEFNDLQKRLSHGETISDHEMECSFSRNRTVPISLSAANITNDAGELVGQVLILRDLSEIRRLQAEVHRQEKLAAMGGLAAGVAHEVRNPLSSIKALATYFAGQFSDGSEAREAAGVMIHEVDRLNHVITELLDLARPSDLNRASSDIVKLISRSIQLIQQDAANKNIRIKIHTENDMCPAWIDPDRLAQCLLNLYINAIQSMDKGGTLTVQCATRKDGYVDVTVSDTGTGIPPEHLSQIFDPYFTTKKRGTGLGLAIVRKIVEAHQGQIMAKSAVDHGSSFTITLPCEPNKAITEE